jgi:hypothetical protein
MDLERLRQAAEEAGFLVTRGYPVLAVATFVAEHRALGDEEQALLACSTRLRAEYAKHIARELEAEDVAKRPLRIDASSVLAAVDAGVSGRTLLESPAGVLADPAWTRPGRELADLSAALERVEAAVASLRPSLVRWYVDESAPWASQVAERVAARTGKRKVEVQLVPNAAAALGEAAYVASSDPSVLDGAACWANLVARALAGVQAPRVRLEG